MGIFDQYSAFYDLFYQDKNYMAECDFILSLLGAADRREALKILDLGCGTGSHACLLARKGHHVTGIDQSETMLSQAVEKAEKENLRIRFEQADVGRFNLQKKFDGILSMFDVMGYLNSNRKLTAAFQRVADHLEKDGRFIFDAWFGPGVINDPPADREKTVQNGDLEIKRTAVPELDLLRQIVSVNYTIELSDGTQFSETHRMRFFFPREMELLAEGSGLKIDRILPLPGDQFPIGMTTWKAVFVLCRE